MVAMWIVQGAARGRRRLPGMSFCSEQQYAANALAKLDPRSGFNFLSIAFPRDFRAGLASVSCTGPEFGDRRGPQRKNLENSLHLFHTILLEYRNHSSTVDIEQGKVKQLGGWKL
jgi:hypothetical protein